MPEAKMKAEIEKPLSPEFQANRSMFRYFPESRKKFSRILILSWQSTFFFKKMGKSATENEFFNFSGEENFHR